MNRSDLDEDAPDEFTSTGECWVYRQVPVPIGAPTHTHVCRELIDDDGRHDGDHRCGCGATF